MKLDKLLSFFLENFEKIDIAGKMTTDSLFDTI